MERSWPHAQQQQRTTSEDGESARQHTASAASRRSSVAIYCREDADDGGEQPVHGRSSAESHYDARYDSGAEVLGRERGRDISGREYGAWDQHDTCGVGARMQTAPANHCQPSDSSHRSVHRHQFSLSADAAALHVAASGYGETAINARGAVFRSPHDQSASKVVPMPLPYSRDRSSSQSRRDQRSLLWFDGEGVDRETTSPLEEKKAAGEAANRPAGLQSSGWFAIASEQHIPLQQMKTSSLRSAAVADEPKPAEQETLTSAAVGRTREGKRRARECRVDGCTNFIIKMGVCFRHGGGRKCSEPGCPSSAKSAGKCWKHGGSVKCVVEGCTRKGKSRGVCWAHGGGTMCSSPLCEKVAVSNGFCWAHGGGKRCAFEGCNKAASKKTLDYCVFHYNMLKDGNVTLEV